LLGLLSRECWDLTNLVQGYSNDEEYQPIIRAAGSDISHWFNLATKSIRTAIDRETEMEIPHLAVPTFLHVPKVNLKTGVVPLLQPWGQNESSKSGNCRGIHGGFGL
jgi:hypothetical protein